MSVPCREFLKGHVIAMETSSHGPRPAQRGDGHGALAQHLVAAAQNVPYGQEPVPTGPLRRLSLRRIIAIRRTGFPELHPGAERRLHGSGHRRRVQSGHIFIALDLGGHEAVYQLVCGAAASAGRIWPVRQIARVATLAAAGVLSAKSAGFT
jgi:hypothetical protein